MMYVIGAVTGLVFGMLIVAIKYYALWRSYLFKNSSEGIKTNELLIRCMISYLVNAFVLLSVFLLRYVISEKMSWVAAITATAIALGLGGKYLSILRLHRSTGSDK